VGVQIIQDVILVPKIMGKVTGLNPAMMMLSLSIWGKLLGLLGMIIALPVTYLLLVYYRRLIHSAPSIANSSRSASNP
jgi:predicted PurR-regulated permease PerM